MNVTQDIGPVIMVVRSGGIRDPRGLVETALAAGVTSVELTLTTPGSLDALRACSSIAAPIGMGTVLSREDAVRAVDAGAHFLVSPVLVSDVLEVGQAAGVPVFPGAFTPNEIWQAWTAGAAAVKVFPARLASPGYLRDVGAVFPDIPLVASGGIGAANAADYLRAGAVAVCSGTSTCPPELVERGEHEEIARRARTLMASVRSAA